MRYIGRLQSHTKGNLPNENPFNAGGGSGHQPSPPTALFKVRPDAETSAEAQPESSAVVADVIEPVALDEDANPFLVESPLFLQYPPYDLIEDEHYLPAFDLGMAEHLAEIEEIATNPEAPTFENTIVAMDLSGRMLNRVSRVFYAMASADTNETIEEGAQRNGATPGGPWRRHFAEQGAV